MKKGSGITDFTQTELGDIVYVVRDNLNQGDVFGMVEAVKTVSDLFLPIDGVIDELSPLLEQKPESVNNDPYGEGG